MGNPGGGVVSGVCVLCKGEAGGRGYGLRVVWRRWLEQPVLLVAPLLPAPAEGRCLRSRRT